MPRLDVLVAAVASFVLLAFVGFTGLIASGVVEGASAESMAPPVAIAADESPDGY